VTESKSESKANEQEQAEGWRGKIGIMGSAEMDEFLGGDILCRLAVLDENGWPYVQPVWHQWEPEEGIFWIVARKRSVWATYMANDKRVALTIDGEARPYRKVALQGVAEVIEEPNVGGAWVEIAKKMATRYLGEHGPDYLVPTLDKARWLFKITPTKLITWQGVDWHQKYKD
jgi:nitroimidazol reductase NimA-like FMN-containing flavoprotein (pyridoxamine 5'-phosphate oxidase superfamily)